jgi:hypothetical protein
MLEAQIGMQRLQQGRLVLHSGPPKVDPHTFVSTTPTAGIIPARMWARIRDGQSRGSPPRPAPGLSELGGPAAMRPPRYNSSEAGFPDPRTNRA